MEFALLFLGLFPMIFMGDLFSPADPSASDEPASDGADNGDTGVDGNGDFLTDTGSAEGDIIAGLDPLQPIEGPDVPVDGGEIDPGDVLAPTEGDETPVDGGNVDPDHVLDPVDQPGEDAPAPGDSSLLQSLLASQSDFDTGAGWIGDYGPATDDISLTEGQDHVEADDGLAGTGEGDLSTHDGTPVVSSPGQVSLVNGSAGDDSIAMGDGAGYAFGGAGNDTISGGEGAAALFGGSGDDFLSLDGSPQGGWADGGDGNDTLIGGDGADQLHGGAHGTGDGATQDDDTIFGGGGDDRITGGYGADTLSGGNGNDVIDHLGRAEQEISAPHHEFAWHLDGDADTLDGGAGNDTLIMDRADSATGGDGYDTFWVYSDDAAGGAAEVTDFRSGEDFLRISLDPDVDHGDINVDVSPSDDGQDGVVTVNGDTIAILRGAPDASAADVRVDVTDNIFG